MRRISTTCIARNQLSEVCNWTSLKSNSAVAIVDLNLDRMRPDKPEGKLLLDLEVEKGFECPINKPTRVEKRGTIITKNLINVLLSNRPEACLNCYMMNTDQYLL